MNLIATNEYIHHHSHQQEANLLVDVLNYLQKYSYRLKFDDTCTHIQESSLLQFFHLFHKYPFHYYTLVGDTPMKKKFKNDNTHRLPGDEKIQLQDSIKDLVSDANRYDYGDFRAIKRSAVTLRLLFYDTHQQTCLLTHLGDKNKIIMQSFRERVTYAKGLSYGDIYMASFRSDTHNEYYNTFLFKPNKSLNAYFKENFNKWWNQNLFFMGDQSKHTKLTRRKLITTIANQDGGAHFDEDVDTSYLGLKTGQTGISIKPTPGASELLGYDVSGYDHNIIFKDISLAYMREVVHEAILSLIDYYSLENIIYQPNFDYNWQRKLNTIGGHFEIAPDDLSK